MSTEILSTMTKTPLDIEAYAETQVGLILGGGAGSYLRKEFIAAVETELNGIFIDTPQEPLAGWEAELLLSADDDNLTADDCDAVAGYYANLAAEKRKVPPVDEQQVEALAQILADKENWPVQDRHKDVARTILASGKVTVND